MNKENEVKEELQEIWRGFMHHVSELNKFMLEHGKNEFFETDLGKKMSEKAVTISLAHLSGLVMLMEPRDEKEKKEANILSGLEDLLSNALKEDN